MRIWKKLSAHIGLVVAIIIGSLFLLSACDTTDNEDDPSNNSFATAQDIAVASTVEGTISEGGEQDYYLVNLQQSGVLDAVLQTVPSDIRLNVGIFDEEQENIAEASAATIGGRAATAARVDAGVYYIRVFRPFGGTFGEASSDEPYQLSISLDRTDVYEINDTFAQAAPVSLGMDIVGTFRPADSNGLFRDRDVYVFEAPQSTNLTFTLSSIPEDLRLSLQVFNEAQESIGARTSLFGEGTIEVSPQLNAGTNYVLITRPGGGSFGPDESATPYTLRIEDS